MHTRTPEVIEAYYTDTWQQVLDQIDALAAEGETDLGRLLSIMSSRYVSDRYGRKPGASRGGGTIEDQMFDGGCLFDDRKIVPRKYDFATMMRAFETVHVSTLLSYIEPDVGRIIELGSGWGRIILRMWSMGGPREAEYIGCEVTASGRSLSERLAKLGGVPKFRARPFDYYDPDFSFLDEKTPTVVVTSYSIEEIHELPEAVIRGIRDIPGLRRCVHIEPVGFQMDGAEWLADGTQVERCTIDSINSTHANDFNRNHNLVPLLSRLADEGILEIERTEKNYLGIVLANAASLIVWRPV